MGSTILKEQKAYESTLVTSNCGTESPDDILLPCGLILKSMAKLKVSQDNHLLCFGQLGTISARTTIVRKRSAYYISAHLIFTMILMITFVTFYITFFSFLLFSLLPTTCTIHSAARPWFDVKSLNDRIFVCRYQCWNLWQPFWSHMCRLNKFPSALANWCRSNNKWSGHVFWKP